jgi:hypothetical protein
LFKVRSTFHKKVSVVLCDFVDLLVFKNYSMNN